jgi:hypothetical protein
MEKLRNSKVFSSYDAVFRFLFIVTYCFHSDNNPNENVDEFPEYYSGTLIVNSNEISEELNALLFKSVHKFIRQTCRFNH